MISFGKHEEQLEGARFAAMPTMVQDDDSETDDEDDELFSWNYNTEHASREHDGYEAWENLQKWAF